MWLYFQKKLIYLLFSLKKMIYSLSGIGCHILTVLFYCSLFMAMLYIGYKLVSQKFFNSNFFQPVCKQKQCRFVVLHLLLGDIKLQLFNTQVFHSIQACWLCPFQSLRFVHISLRRIDWKTWKDHRIAIVVTSLSCFNGNNSMDPSPNHSYFWNKN